MAAAQKQDHTFHWIDTLRWLRPSPTLHRSGNSAKMIDPEIHGVDYQHGQTYGFFDERYYVLQEMIIPVNAVANQRKNFTDTSYHLSQ